MRKNNPRYKQFLKIRALKIFKKRLFRKYKKRGYYVRNALERPKIKEFDMPENFSLINNFNELIGLFELIEKTIHLKDFHYNVVSLNFKKVKKITVDALMYLLVFIKNTRNNHKQDIYIKGNLPENKECADLIKNTGFLSYLTTSIKQEYSEENIKINVGNLVEPEIFKEICDFVQKKLCVSRSATSELYNSLGEIVGNSIEHAYSGDVYWNKWLSFAKFDNGVVKIVLLDTGFGILSTMRKRIVGDLFNNDCELLESALIGDGRSETKLAYRNKGLPRIRENAKNGYLKKLSLISNDVLYTCYNKEESYKMLDKSLDGTLYYFELTN